MIGVKARKGLDRVCTRKALGVVGVRAVRKGVGRLGKDLVVIPRKFPHNDPSTSSRISPMTAAVKVRYQGGPPPRARSANKGIARPHYLYGKNVDMGNPALADPCFECNVRRAVVISLKKMSLTAVFHDNSKQRPRQGRRIALLSEMWYLR